MSDTYGVIRDAIRRRSRLLVRHHGVWLTLCPYMLGWCDEHPYLVAWVAAGTPGWAALRVAEVSAVRLADGPWLPGTALPAPDMEMDLEVEVAAWCEAQPAVHARRSEPEDAARTVGGRMSRRASAS